MDEYDYRKDKRWLMSRNFFPLRMYRKIKSDRIVRKYEKLSRNPDFVDPEDYSTNDGKGWVAQYLMCIKCGERMVSVHGADLKTDRLECPQCHRYGWMIRTYEELFTEDEDE